MNYNIGILFTHSFVLTLGCSMDVHVVHLRDVRGYHSEVGDIYKAPQGRYTY